MAGEQSSLNGTRAALVLCLAISRWWSQVSTSPSCHRHMPVVAASVSECDRPRPSYQVRAHDCHLVTKIAAGYLSGLLQRRLGLLQLRFSSVSTILYNSCW